MHDQETVGVLNSAAGLAEQLQTFVQSEIAGSTVLVDGPRVADMLHDDIRFAFGGDSAVEETTYIRMLEVGQNLALILKAAKDQIALMSGSKELDGDLLAILLIGAGSEKNDTHATAT